MAKKIIKIESEKLAKLITMHVSGSLLLMTGRQLTPDDIMEIKKAIQIDLDNENYLKAARTFDELVSKTFN